MITNKTHRLVIEREAGGVALCKVEPIDEGNPFWAVVDIDHKGGQVFSVDCDSPIEGGRWFARLGAAGVAYVAKLHSNRATATRKFRRVTAEDRSLEY